MFIGNNYGHATNNLPFLRRRKSSAGTGETMLIRVPRRRYFCALRRSSPALLFTPKSRVQCGFPKSKTGLRWQGGTRKSAALIHLLAPSLAPFPASSPFPVPRLINHQWSTAVRDPQVSTFIFVLFFSPRAFPTFSPNGTENRGPIRYPALPNR